jgi:hypothetical protein
MTALTAARLAPGHCFHDVCIVAWSQCRVNCPICEYSEMPPG